MKNLVFIQTIILKTVIEKIYQVIALTYTKLNINFRTQIFKEFAKSNEYGLIFTCCFDFDVEKEWDIIKKWRNIFKETGGECYFIELETTLEERLKRNRTPHRLECKASKRDLEWSENDILKSIKKHRLNSNPGEIKFENYYRIDNTNISAEEVAKIIKENFNL